MRAFRRSPLFRIALLTLLVLFAHTIRANTQPIAVAHPSCNVKLSTAHPDSNKKLLSAIRRSASRPHRNARGSFGGALRLAHASALLPALTTDRVTTARAARGMGAQQRPFVLRL